MAEDLRCGCCGSRDIQSCDNACIDLGVFGYLLTWIRDEVAFRCRACGHYWRLDNPVLTVLEELLRGLDQSRWEQNVKSARTAEKSSTAQETPEEYLRRLAANAERSA